VAVLAPSRASRSLARLFHFTVGLGIGDEDVFHLGGIIGAIIGVIILLPFVGIVTRFSRRHQT
jgi:hypothetical protein